MKSYYRIGLLLAWAASAAAQPKACAVLAKRAASAGADTARIQAALGCAPGRAVVLERAGQNARFESGPLVIPGGVTLFVDRGVTLAASRHRRDYDLAPGSCGAPPAGQAAQCKPFVFACQAAFSGLAGAGTIDGQGDAWRGAPAGAVIPGLVSSYESQGFRIEGVTLRNAACVHAAIYKTTALEISNLKIDSAMGDGLLLSNTTDAQMGGLWIRVPGEAVSLKASIPGATGGVHISGLHIFGGRGIALGDPAYGPVRDVTVDGIAMDGIAVDKIGPGCAFLGGQTRAIRIRNGCVNTPLAGAPWSCESVASGNCGNPEFAAVPVSTLSADVSAVPVPGRARSLVVAQDRSAPFSSVQQAIDARRRAAARSR